MQEIWLPVVGYDAFYEVSNTGFVRSLPRFARIRGGGLRPIAPTTLKTYLTGSGYPAIAISINGHTSKHYVHRLVATAFIANPRALPEVNHLDSNKSNNASSNLEWTSRQGNEDHKVSSRRSHRGDDNVRSKLTSLAVAEVKAALATGESQKSIATRFSVSQASICRINTGKSWVPHPD